MYKKFIAASFIFGLACVIFLGHFRSIGTRQIKETDQQNQKIDISDWKTYKNSDFGYSIKYPPNWKLDKTGADYYSKLLKDPNYGKLYKKYPEEVRGATINLTDPEKDVLVFSYGYAELGYPLHVFKSKVVNIDGEKVYKTYLDGCDLFIPVIYIRSGYDCRNKKTLFYSVIYSDTIGTELFNPAQYKWSSGNLGTYLSIATLHGYGATIWLNLSKPLDLEDPNFGERDRILDAIISSIKFN